jgi:hypothetical protein
MVRTAIKMEFGMKGRLVGWLILAPYNAWGCHKQDNKKRERCAGALHP